MTLITLSCFLILCVGFSNAIDFDWDAFMKLAQNNKNSDAVPVDWKAAVAQHKKRVAQETGQTGDPYNITFAPEGDYTRITFDSLIYKDKPLFVPRRYMLVNNLPDNCAGQEDLPYGVFLTGFGATPENYSIGFPNITAMISGGEICCFYAFMPFFAYFPFGGFWYTNNQFTVPENYLFLEVLSVIEHAMGSKVTRDPQRRALVGHSMGGYGAVMNAMRTDMQFFGQTCGINGGLYIWNLPEFQDSIHEKVLNEAVVRKETIFQNCNYTQPPNGTTYRYYADALNFNTQIGMSLASVFHSDGTTKAKPNSPYYFFANVNPDCTKYTQTFGYNFWLDEKGNKIPSLFEVAPWNSPEGFARANYPSLRKSMSGNLFLSITYQDEIVDFQENVVFSQKLNELGINHTLFLYNGTHRDPFPGIVECFKTFEKRLCAAPGPAPTTTTIPVWLFWTGVAVVIVETLLILGFVGRFLYTKYTNNNGYEEIPF